MQATTGPQQPGGPKGLADNNSRAGGSILNEKVFVPTTGGSYDDDAIAIYEEALPG